MEKKIILFITLCVIWILGCSVKISPHGIPPYYVIPCYNEQDEICFPPNSFYLDVSRNRASGPFTWPKAYLIINGEQYQMSLPESGSIFGRYSLESCTIPHSGDMRFRYMFYYNSGSGISASSDKRIYYPTDAYLFRPIYNDIGMLNWSSPAIQEIPNNNISYNGMSNIIKKTYTFSSNNETGDFIISASIIFTNTHEENAVILHEPEVKDRETDTDISDITLSTSESYPIYFEANTQIEYQIICNTHIENSTPKSIKAKLIFPFALSPLHRCKLTIWTNLDYQ